MLYETRLPHTLDMEQLERAIRERYAYELINAGLHIRRKTSRNGSYYFNVYRDGRITLKARSDRTANRRIHRTIDWLKEEGFIILDGKPKVRPVKT